MLRRSMRYRDGHDPALSAWGTTDEVLLFTVVLSLFIGVALVWLGRKGRQMWLVFWSGGLVIASIAYLGWAAFWI